MGDEQKATFEYTAAFRTLSGEHLSVELSQLILTDDGLRLTGEVDTDTFMHIERDMVFNMLPQVKTPHEAASFRPGFNVEIELMLRPALLNVWRSQGITELEDMMSAIFNQESHNLYMESECWLLTQVLQPLVVNVKEGIFGKAGFQTLWAKGLKPDLTPQQMVLEYLDDKGWAYERPDETVLRIYVGTEAGRWIFLIDVDTEQQMIVCFSIFPRNIAESRRAALAEYLFNVNYNIAVGNFEMDEEDGDLRFRTSLYHGSGTVSREMVARLVDLNVGIMGDFYRAIEQLTQE